MLFKDIALLDENMEIQHHMQVGIRDDKISYIGKEEPKEDYGEIYDGKNKLLMPGLINAHAHTPMTLLRGYGENMALQDWLEKRIFPFEALLNKEDVYYGYLLGVAEMLRFGVVATTDMYYFGESMAKAVIDSGFKSNIGLSVVCFNDQDYQQLPIYREVTDVYNNYHMAGEGRLRVDLSVHAEYTSTPKVVAAVAEHCRELGLRMHIHLSETKKEHEECKMRNQGKTPAQYFASLGLFDNPTTAAHCIYLEPEDFTILAEKQVTIATNPVSNLKLASGICNVAQAMKQGINIALGTDSVASNNNLNMFEEIKLYAILHKYYAGDPTIITPSQALAAATINGSRSQGRSDSGLIKEGYKADLIVLDIDQPYMKPIHSLLNNVVYSACGTDVCLTMIDGKVLYKDGVYTTLDLERITYEVEKSRNRILSQL